MARTVHIIGAGLAGLAAAVKLAPSQAKRRRARSHRLSGRPLPVLFRPHHRHDDRQRQSSGAVGQSCGGGFRGSDRQRRAAWSGRDMRSFRSSISPRTSAGRCGSMTACRGGFSTRTAAFQVPRLGEYLRLVRLLRVAADAPVGDVIDCSGPLYHRLVHPLLLAALNIEPREGSAALASAVVRETLAAGGQACRPLIARDGLGPAFIEPAMKHLRERNVEVRLDHELRALRFAEGTDRRARFRRRDHGARAPTTRSSWRCRSHAAARARPRSAGAAGSSRDRQRAFPHRRAAEPAADARHHQRHDRMGLRVRRPAVGHDQQCRPSDGRAARDAGSDDMAGGVAGDGNCRRTAAVADRPRAAGDLRGDSGRKRQASRLRGRHGTISFWPETGPRPDCRRRWRARCGPAIERRRSS